jgi:hypothetical protein
VCEPEKNWSDVSGKHDFPLQRRVAPTVNYRQELFGRHVYNVFGSNTPAIGQASWTRVFQEPLMRREVESLRPPIF